MNEKNQVVVLGVGLHRFGRLPDKTLEDLGREAAVAALQDAGIDFKEVQAGFLGRVQMSVGLGQRIFREMGRHGIPLTNIELPCASASRGAMLAAELVAGG